MDPTAGRRDEGNLVTVGDCRIPVSKFSVERGPDRFTIGVEARVQLSQGVVYVGHGRADAELDALSVGASQLAQAGEQPRPHGDRDSHQNMLMSDEDVDFLA